MRVTQWVAVAVVVVALGAGVARASDPPKGTVIAEEIIAVWHCQDNLGVPRTPVYYSPWRMGRHSRGFAVAQMNRWTNRLIACERALNEKKRQWNPQAWLPGNWATIANCETSTDWYFTGHSTDGYFVSAFAISVQVYDRDAAYMHVRPWYVKGRGTPSPWEQYQAALGHYHQFGDGWTGHCHGYAHL